MTFDENVSMLSLAFYKVIMICGPLLGLALAIGLLIGIFQFYQLLFLVVVIFLLVS